MIFYWLKSSHLANILGAGGNSVSSLALGQFSRMDVCCQRGLNPGWRTAPLLTSHASCNTVSRHHMQRRVWTSLLREWQPVRGLQCLVLVYLISRAQGKVTLYSNNHFFLSPIHHNDGDDPIGQSCNHSPADSAPIIKWQFQLYPFSTKACPAKTCENNIHPRPKTKAFAWANFIVLAPCGTVKRSI